MTNWIQKTILCLSLLLLFSVQANSQTYLVSKTEIVGIYDGTNYRMKTELEGEYILVRTDREGAIAWVSGFETFEPLDSTQSHFYDNSFIVAGVTEMNIRKDRIKGTPGDYDYWLVPYDQVSSGFVCFPNPTNGNVKIIIDGKSNYQSFKLFDSHSRLIEQIGKTDSNTMEMDLSNLPDGVYFLCGMTVDGRLTKTAKIIKL